MSERTGGNMLTVTLPWPTKTLSPNSRTHWSSKARAVKCYRRDAFYLAREVLPRGWELPAPKAVKVTMHFYPPTKRHFDLDGLQSRCKAGQDGIFDALDWDDRIIISTTAEQCEILPGGLVAYTIEVLS